MDKIKALMIKVGLKPELAAHLCESIRDYNIKKDARREAEYNNRLDQAKQVCLEEVESFKLDLARRMQIFCEAKGGQIEQSVARQTAIRDSEAQIKLRNIHSLLEGVEPNGGLSGNLQAENAKLKRQYQKLRLESRQAVETANRQSAIAGKVLKTNRLLEKQLQENRRGSANVLAENRSPKQAVRIDEQRRQRPSGVATTTRSTLRENQERRQPTKPVHRGDPYSIDGIAASIESDLI